MATFIITVHIIKMINFEFKVLNNMTCYDKIRYVLK